MANTTTLRRMLTQPKPMVPYKTRAGKNSKNERWPFIIAGNITLWDDFNIETLNESYGHILDLEISAEQQVEAPRAEDVLHGMEITEPDEILKLVGWNDRLLRPTLEFAKQHLDLHPGVRLHHRSSTPTKLSRVRMADNQRPTRIDHFVSLDNFSQSPNLIIGLARPSSKFQGRRLAKSPSSVNMEGLWPLRQLGNMCKMAETRYGYIMTDQDLVVCCFHNPEAEGEQVAQYDGEKEEEEQLRVALMPVPWTRHGETQLTSDIALWWLAMLALSSAQPHDVVTEAEMVGIGEWEVRHLDDERGWVRRHRYSIVEQPADPPPPPAYQTPSPGNQAAIEAAVGLHADASFDINPDYVFNFNDHNLLYNNYNSDNNFNNDINFNDHNFNNGSNFSNDNDLNNNFGFNDRDVARD